MYLRGRAIFFLRITRSFSFILLSLLFKLFLSELKGRPGRYGKPETEWLEETLVPKSDLVESLLSVAVYISCCSRQWRVDCRGFNTMSKHFLLSRDIVDCCYIAIYHISSKHVLSNICSLLSKHHRLFALGLACRIDT